MNNLRFAIRLLLKKPLFFVIAVFTIALGIGSNTAVFSFVNAILLKSLPFPNPSQLVEIFTSRKSAGVEQDIFSATNFLDLTAFSRSYKATAAFTYENMNLAGGQEPVSLTGTKVSGRFFRVLGITPHLGRWIRPEDDRAGVPAVVVLSFHLWQTRFGGDPQIIGRRILIDSKSCEVIGVAPKDAEFPLGTDLWIPLALTEEQRNLRGAIYLEVIARLNPDTILQAANAEMQLVAKQLQQVAPSENAGIGLTVLSLHDQVVGDVRMLLVVLSAAVGFVLLIACANIANLLLAEGSSRSREFAVRAAIGAGRTHLIRQLLTESLVLSVLGGIAGLLFALWGIAALRALSPADMPRLETVAIDGTVLAFTAALSIITGLLFGIWPALGMSQPQLQESLKEAGRGGGVRRNKKIGSALIVGQVSLVLVLLIGAGLLIRSFLSLRSVNPGFQPDNLISLYVSLPEGHYPEPASRIDFQRRLSESVSQMPDVESVELANPGPFGPIAEIRDMEFHLTDRPEPPAGQIPLADFCRITPNYFHTMRIPLLQGRSFTENDDQNASRVAIINRTFARKFWNEKNVIGQKIKVGSSLVVLEIVGVVGDVLHNNLQRPIRPEIYMPYAQSPKLNFTVYVRTKNDPEKLMQALRSRIALVDKELPLQNMLSMESVISRSLAPSRSAMTLLTGFSAIALLMAMMGLYGLISHSVNNRIQEIGVRMALGARQMEIIRLVLGQGLTLTIIGLLAGLLASFLIARLLSGLLYGIQSFDPLTFACVPVVLMLTAVAACYFPARRAGRIDPASALKYE